MEKAFYDYKKRKYEILDAVGQNDWQIYLIQSPEGKYYIANMANVYFQKSAKPLRSVFSRYEANVMYDIPKYCQELQNNELLEYEKQKYDVLAYDAAKKQGIETAERREKAIANGWSELNADNAHYSVSGDTLSIIFDDKQFSIKQRSKELSFGSMTEAELKAYANQWITSYNNTIGNLSQAQTMSDCKIQSDRKVAQWVQEGKATSELLTEKLVESLDITDKYDGYQGDAAMAMAVSILDYMRSNSIPYFNTAELMGDCSSLSYDIYDVICFHQIYSSKIRGQAITAILEAQALSYLEDRGVLPLNAAVQGAKEYTETVAIPNPDELDLTAKKYFNETIGTECYDLVLKSKNPYFETPACIIGSCNQGVLNKLLGKTAQETSKPLNAVNNVSSEDSKSTTTTAKPQKQWQM